MNRVYLDYNATTPLRPQSRDAVLHALDAPRNASSIHGFGREARHLVEDARQHVAALVGAPATQVIFNSGATEANNTVIKHFAGEKIAVSAIEHPSILEAAPDATRIPVTAQGLVDLNALEDILKAEKHALVCAMLANNETGAIQPIAQISALARKHGAMIHCDAVQALGRIPVNITELGVDFMSISSHKIGGPQGTGALILGLCGITPTLLIGGGQEKSARAGTENVAAISGFGAAAQQALSELSGNAMQAHTLRDHLESEIIRIAPETLIHAYDAPRIGNTSFFSLPGIKSETILMSFDLDGIAVSNGSACSSGTVRASHVLTAMGVAPKNAGSAIRVSLGWDTKPEDVDAFLRVWSKLYDRLQPKIRNNAHA